MKAPELHTMGAEELGDRLREAKEELFNLRFQYATGQLDNTARLRQVRKDIARILTVMREQEIEAYYAQLEDSQEEEA